MSLSETMIPSVVAWFRCAGAVLAMGLFGCGRPAAVSGAQEQPTNLSRPHQPKPTEQRDGPSAFALASPPPEASSPFFFAAVVDDEHFYDVDSHELHLFDLGAKLFAASGRYLVELRGNEVIAEEEFVRAMKLGKRESLRELVGEWPDDMWAVIDYWPCPDDTPCEFLHQRVARYQKGRWVSVPTKGEDINRVLPVNEQLLVMSRDFPASTVPELSFTSAKGGPPRAITLSVSDPTLTLDHARITAVAQLRDGRVLVGCEAQEADLVGILVPGESAMTFERLPCGGSCLYSMATAPDGTVALAGHELTTNRDQVGYLATYDGEHWRCQHLPEATVVSAIAFGTDGSLWALGQSEDGRSLVYSGLASGAIQRVSLPDFRRDEGRYRPRAREIFVVGQDDVWIAASVEALDNKRPDGAINVGIRRRFEALLHNHETASVARMPNTDEAERRLDRE